MKEKRSYVVVFSDKYEHFSEIQYHPESFNAKRICEDAVRARGLKTSRKNPQKVAVQLFGLEISKGELTRRLVINCEVFPALERMNEDEYSEELLVAIEDLPLEFQQYVRSTAWERGHSAGYEEVVLIAQNIASDLKPHVERYQKRIMQGLI
jgi:hypothetical protein